MIAKAQNYWGYLEKNYPELVDNPDKPYTFDEWKRLDKIFKEFNRKQNDNNHSKGNR